MQYVHRIAATGIMAAALLAMAMAAPGVTPVDAEATHFRPPPVLQGTPEQCNALIRGWLTEGVSNIVADLGRLAVGKDLDGSKVAPFRQRVQKDESLGAPVEAAITNAQAVISAMEGFMLSPQPSPEARKQTEVNLEEARQQLDLLLLNQERVAVVKKQLQELGKTCAYWEQFWNITVRAAGPDETRRQLKMLIEQERARLQTWIQGERGLKP